MFDTENVSGAVIIRFTETRFDAANAPEFRERTADIVGDGVSRVLLDLSALRAIDSSGLGAMVGLLKRIGASGDLKLFGLSAPVAKVVQLTRMDRVFSLYPDRSSAVASLES